MTDPRSVTFTLGGRTVPVLSCRLNRSIDTMADQAIVEFPWTPGADTELDKLAHLFAYSPCTITLGSTLSLTGRVYNTENKLSTSGRTKTLECYSNTVDLVDSDMPTSVRGQYQGGVFLDTMARDIGSFFNWPYGLKVTMPAGNRGRLFDLVDYSITEKCGKILERLAFQSGLLVSNDVNGNLLFQDASKLAGAPPVGTLQEGDGLPNEFAIKADGRARFGIYVAVGQSGDADSVFNSQIDSVVPRWRREVFVIEDTNVGGTVSASQLKRSKQIVQALTMGVAVSSWYAPNGQLWAPGMMVTIKSPTMEIPDGFTFLVRETEHVMSGEGFTCTIKVVPPQAYTVTPIQEPWVNAWVKTTWAQGVS